MALRPFISSGVSILEALSKAVLISSGPSLAMFDGLSFPKHVSERGLLYLLLLPGCRLIIIVWLWRLVRRERMMPQLHGALVCRDWRIGDICGVAWVGKRWAGWVPKKNGIPQSVPGPTQSFKEFRCGSKLAAGTIDSWQN